MNEMLFYRIGFNGIGCFEKFTNMFDTFLQRAVSWLLHY